MNPARPGFLRGNRREFLQAAAGRALVAGATLAAGCRPSGGPSGATGSAAPIRIGEFSSLTGREAGLGQYTHLGVQLALEEINAAGGVLGRPLELVAEDTRSQAGEAATAVHKLLRRDRVAALIGESASGRCLEGAPLAQQAGVPLVSPAATHPRVTEIGDCIFRVCFTDPFQGTLMARFARETLGVQRAGLLVDTAATYSVGLASFFRRHFEAGGGTIAAEQRFSGGDKDFRAQLTALKAAGVGAIFAPSYYGDGGLILRQARQLGFAGPMLGGDGWEAPELVGVAGTAADGAFFPVHFSLEDPAGRTREFGRRFEARFGRSPTGVSALGYDALQLIADAIRRAGSAEPAAIRAALAATRGFEGLTGRIELDDAREVRKPAAIIEVRGGRFTFLRMVTP